jgi:hypothetical protein
MAHSPDKRAQTRRRGRGTKNNLRGWQLQQAGVGVGRGPGPLRNAGIGSPGCGHPDKAGPAARVSSARPNVACPACIARSASRSGPAADWHAGKVAASGRSIRPTRLTQGGPRYSQKHRGDLKSAAPEFRLVHLLGVRLAQPTPTVIARNVFRVRNGTPCLGRGMSGPPPRAVIGTLNIYESTRPRLQKPVRRDRSPTGPRKSAVRDRLRRNPPFTDLAADYACG